MLLLLAIAVAILFGSGSFLLLKHDLIRVAIGMVLISNAANLFIMSAALTRGAAPIYPLPAGEAVSDPLVQAMALTAIVIGFATIALLLVLVYRVYTSHETVDLDELSNREAAHERELERERISV